MHREFFILTSSYSLTIRARSLERNITNYHNYLIVQLLEILYYTFNFWHYKMWSAKYTWCAFPDNLTLIQSTSYLCTIFVLLTWNYTNPTQSSLLPDEGKTYVCFKNTYFKSFLLYGKHPKTVFSISRKNPNEIPLSSLTCNLVNYFFSADLQEHLKQRSSVYRNLADFLIVYFWEVGDISLSVALPYQDCSQK